MSGDDPVTGKVVSADGSTIAYDQVGTGPAVILVNGAFADRTHPTLRTVAASLAPWFSVINYDRRGRGDSGDNQPYTVHREIEDIEALTAGGSAMVFGGSSGAALALRAAAALPAITKLVAWEPPYHVDSSAPTLPPDFASALADLVAAGRRGAAVERFMIEAAEVPAAGVAAMRADPSWAKAEAVAGTLAYEAAVLGPANALPVDLLATISQPTLVLTGGRSPSWMARAGEAVAAAVPGARHRVLENEAHNVTPEALVAELLEFFIAG